MIQVPSLRDCKKDIPLYIEHFLAKANAEIGKAIEGFDNDVLKLLVEYSWPGNIRELKNIIYRLVLISKEPKISMNFFMDNIPAFMKNYFKEK
jgi:two-component system response regulator HydG